MVGCQETWDDNPKLDPAPSTGGYEEFLNIPYLANQNIVLTPETQDGIITLTCSQPDYGFAASVNYSVQLSFSSEFDTPVAAGCPAYYQLETVYHNCSNISFTNWDLYQAFVTMFGIEEAAQVPAAPYKLYIRLMAQIERQMQATGIVPNTTIYSNVVSINSVKLDYYQPLEPGDLYIIGEPQGWNINEGSLTVHETGAGTGIFTGSLDVPEGKFMFRFYSKLGDWETNSIGSQVDDNPINITIGADGYIGDCVWGKGSWSVPDWAGGIVDIVVDLNDMTVSFVPAVPRDIYIVGACQGWDINSKAMTLKETGVGTDIYVGTFDIAADQFQFKIYTALGDWETNHYGAQVEDNNVNISMASGSYTGPCVDGKGNWNASDWAGGEVTIEVNLKALTVTFTAE